MHWRELLTLEVDDQEVQCTLCDHKFRRDSGLWSEAGTWHCPKCTIQLWCDADTGEVIGFGPLVIDDSKPTSEQKEIVLQSFSDTGFAYRED